MFPRQLLRLPQRQEKLASIIVLSTSIRHSQQSAPVELEPTVQLISKGRAMLEAAFAAGTGAGGVAALDDERGDEAVEDGAGVVAVEAVLEEVAGGEWGLGGEELEEDIAGGGLEEDFGGGLRLEVVDLSLIHI